MDSSALDTIDRAAGGELDAVIGDIADLLRPSSDLTPEALARLAEAVFLVGARYGAQWAEGRDAGTDLRAR
jgi:hypothetical protein